MTDFNSTTDFADNSIDNFFSHSQNNSNEPTDNTPVDDTEATATTDVVATDTVVTDAPMSDDANPSENGFTALGLSGSLLKSIVDMIKKKVKNKISKKIKTVVACGNGTAGIFAPDILRGIGFEVKLKPFIQRIDSSAKGDWDVGITVDILEYAEESDIIILASGDGDFDILVKKLIEKYNSIVEVYGVKQLTAISLINSASKFVSIESDLLLNP